MSIRKMPFSDILLPAFGFLIMTLLLGYQSWRLGKELFVLFTGEDYRVTVTEVKHKSFWNTYPIVFEFDGKAHEVNRHKKPKPGDVINVRKCDSIDLIVPKEGHVITILGFVFCSILLLPCFSLILIPVLRPFVKLFFKCWHISFLQFNPVSNLLRDFFRIEDYCVTIDNLKYEKISHSKCKVTGHSGESKTDYYDYIEEVIIPEEINIHGDTCIVTELVDSCFEKCVYLTSIQLPDTVTKLGNSCFDGCHSLKDIHLSNKIKKLGYRCFACCSSLTSIQLPDTITELGDYCFVGCDALNDIQLPNKIKKLGDSCFDSCFSLTSIQLPDALTELKNNCFYGCEALITVQLSNNIEKLGDSCFDSCFSLTSIQLPKKVTELGKSCFRGCGKLVTLEMSENIKKLGYKCFYYCRSLTSIQLPDIFTKAEIILAFGKAYPRKKEFNEALGSLLAMLCMIDESIETKEKQAVFNSALAYFGRINAVVIEEAFLRGLNSSYIELNNNFETYIKNLIDNQNYQEIYVTTELMFDIAKSADGILPEEWNLMQRIMRAVGLSNIAIDHLNTNYKCDFRQSKEQSNRHTKYKCDFRQSKKQSNRHNSKKNQSKSSNTTSSLDMYYRTLGLEPTANQDEIRKAYHNLAKMYHPDAVRDPALKEFMAEKFKAIAEAYDRLTHKS